MADFKNDLTSHELKEMYHLILKVVSEVAWNATPTFINGDKYEGLDSQKSFIKLLEFCLIHFHKINFSLYNFL